MIIGGVHVVVVVVVVITVYRDRPLKKKKKDIKKGVNQFVSKGTDKNGISS